MTNAEIPVFFYELEEGKVAGKEKLADFLASDVASPIL